MEDSLERLEKRCKHIIRGSCQYKDTVQGLSGRQMNFADSLEDFCGGTDEESMLLGRPASVLFSMAKNAVCPSASNLASCKV